MIELHNKTTLLYLLCNIRKITRIQVNPTGIWHDCFVQSYVARYTYLISTKNNRSTDTFVDILGLGIYVEQRRRRG